MTSKRSTLPLNAESLRRMLAEKEALLGERETQLAERDRLIAVRDAELYAKTLQIEHLKAPARGAATDAVWPLLGEARPRDRAARTAARRTRGRRGGEQRARRAGRAGARQPEARPAEKSQGDGP